MEPECRRITREMVPAVRAYLAEAMKARYGYTQQEIAKKLGIAQVAVSKYINLKYSRSVARTKSELAKEIEHVHLVKSVMQSKTADEANERIERFCGAMIG